MYCQKCGKLIPEDARFCKYCGSDVNKETIVMIERNSEIQKSDLKIIWAALMMISTAIITVAGFLPMISVELFFDTAQLSVWDLWKLAIDWGVTIDGDSDTVLFVFVAGIISLSYVISLIMGILMFINLCMGRKGEGLVFYSDYGSGSCIVGSVLLLATQVILNENTSEYFWGLELLSIPWLEWLILILPFVNIFLFSKRYLEEVAKEQNR